VLAARGLYDESYEVEPAPFLAGDTTWRVEFSRQPYYQEPGTMFVHTRDLAMLWKTHGDSVSLTKHAFLGYGFETRGAWRGDTLSARSHSYSDSVDPSREPRANAFGVRYECLDFEAAGRAAAVTNRLAQVDTPDIARDRLEREAQDAWIRDLLDQIRAEDKAR